jgi:hypothetical protein
MQQLIDQLTTKFGISGEQAIGIIGTIKEYATSKFPAFSSSINMIFTDDNSTSKQAGSETVQDGTSAGTGHKEGVFEKAKEFAAEHISGGLKEKVEDMKEKAEEMLDSAGSKIKGLFK